MFSEIKEAIPIWMHWEKNKQMFNKYIGRSLATFQKPVTVCPDFETAEAEPPILWPPDARS